MPPVILWFRRDLRLADNPALSAAVATGQPVLAVYVHDEATPGTWAPGGASRWWLHHSLAALAADLAQIGGRLALRRGRYQDVIPALAAECGATAVHAALPVEPWARQAMRAVKAALPMPLVIHPGPLLHHPDALLTQAGRPYTVFTPFSRAFHALGEVPPPRPAPTRVLAHPAASEPLADWRLLPRRPDWAGGLRTAWTPSEAGAQAALAAFATGPAHSYAARRDFPGEASTSRLSPHLAFGTLSPRQAWTAGGDKFRAELLWREFSAHLLWHHQDLPEAPLRAPFAHMPWREDPAGLAAWQRGRTGIPIVDAGMRELWATGWMHNRVRMIVASFLVKHLLIDWRHGEAWFWDTLVDADLAANAASWQWVAGSGADAAPYFRIFNPVLQGEKFDAGGAYVRAWVPELATVHDRFIHAPWNAPPTQRPPLYPSPIIDLATGRERALAAFASINRGGLGSTAE